MDYKAHYKDLVDKIKSTVTRDNGRPIRNEDIANRLGYERTYFSSLLGDRGEITQKHIRVFEKEFAEELKNSKLEDVVKSHSEGSVVKGESDRITILERALSRSLEQIQQLQNSLDVALQRQQVIAAMTDASLEALLFDMADRKKLARGEVKRSVRNRAFSKLHHFEANGIVVEAYM